MLLFVGLIICIFVSAGNGVVNISPSGNPVYFSVGAPATISCTAEVLSGNVDQLIYVVQLIKTTDINAPLACLVSRNRDSLEYLFPTPFGNVSLNRSFFQQSTVTCSYTLSTIQDGTYNCSALYLQSRTETQGINIMTTKPLDDLFINNGSSVIAANEGDSISISCVATNSKPGYSMSWSSAINGGNISTSNSTSNGYINSTTSLTVVASASMNGQTLTCSASSQIPDLGSRSVPVTFNIYYGPSDRQSSVTTSSSAFICPLDSNPQISSYTWRLDNNTLLQCSERQCLLTQQQVQTGSQITCEGQNPVTRQFAKATINFVWSASSTGSATVTGASISGDPMNSDLTGGAIAGIVIGVVAFIVLVIVIPITVCMKRKRVKGASAGNDTNANRRSTTPASVQSSSRPYSFENTSGGGHKSPLSAQPDVVRNSGFSPSASDPGQPHKAPSTPPPAYPGAMDMIDQKPRSRKPIALYDTALDDAYPNQTNASYMPSPKY